MPLISLITATFLLLTSSAYSFDYDSYSKREIEDICNDHINSTKQFFGNKPRQGNVGDTNIVSSEDQKIRLKLKYLGQIRNLSNEHHEDMIFFERTFPQMSPKVSQISTKEVLMASASGSKYWLPIQDILVEPLKNEAAKNQGVYVYALVLRHVVSPSYQCRGSYLISEFRVIKEDDLHPVDTD